MSTLSEKYSLSIYTSPLRL